MTEEESSESSDIRSFLEGMRKKLGSLSGITLYTNNKEETVESLKGRKFNFKQIGDLITAYDTVGELKMDCEKVVEIAENLFNTKSKIEEDAETIEKMTEENQRFEYENEMLLAQIANFEVYHSQILIESSRVALSRYGKFR